MDLILRRIYRTRRSCVEGALAVADMAEGDPHRTGQIVGKVEALVRGDVGRESRVERQARTRGSERRRIDDALGQFRSVEAQPAAELRSEERRVGKEVCGTCRTRRSPYH